MCGGYGEKESGRAGSFFTYQRGAVSVSRVREKVWGTLDYGCFYHNPIDKFRLNEYTKVSKCFRPDTPAATRPGTLFLHEAMSMNGYITVQEAAKRWGITPRQVQILCKGNRVEGAARMSRIWIIPEDAKKPVNQKK